MPAMIMTSGARHAPVIAAALTLLAAWLFIPQLLDLQNVNQVLRQMAVPAIMALGVTFVVIAGRLDLSVGSVLSCSAIATITLLNEVGPVAAIAVALAIGVLVGCLNGFLVAYLRLNSLIATLGTLSIVQGLALIYTGGANVVMSDLEATTWFTSISRGYMLGLPSPVALTLVLAVLCGVLLHASTFGRKVFAVGGNSIASAYSSIDVRRTLFATYVIADGFAAIAGVVYASRVMTARHDSGVGLELLVLSAVILGGTSLIGGSGSILRSILGIVVIGAMQSALLLLGFPFYMQWIAVAAVLIAAAWMNVISRTGREVA